MRSSHPRPPRGRAPPCHAARFAPPLCVRAPGEPPFPAHLGTRRPLRGWSGCVTDDHKRGTAASTDGSLPSHPGRPLYPQAFPLAFVCDGHVRVACVACVSDLSCPLASAEDVQNHPGLVGEMVGERVGGRQGSERGTSV